MCMGTFPSCISVYHVHAWCSLTPDEGNGVPRTGVNQYLQATVWVLESNLDPLEEQVVSALNYCPISPALQSHS